MVKYLICAVIGGLIVLIVGAALIVSRNKKPTESKKRAWWIVKRDEVSVDFMCSNCGCTYTEADPDSALPDTYCRCCGAEMVVLDD